MKKSLALICSLALCLGLFAGCSSSNAGGSASPSASVPASPSQEASQAPAALSGVVIALFLLVFHRIFAVT